VVHGNKGASSCNPYTTTKSNTERLSFCAAVSKARHTTYRTFAVQQVLRNAVDEIQIREAAWLEENGKRTVLLRSVSVPSSPSNPSSTSTYAAGLSLLILNLLLTPKI
jgi:hypothetical protein